MPDEVEVVLLACVFGLSVFFVRQIRSTCQSATRLARLQAFIRTRRVLEEHRRDNTLSPAEIREGELFLNDVGAEFGFLPYPPAAPAGETFVPRSLESAS